MKAIFEEDDFIRLFYTRPETILYKKKKYKVPKVLQTGHHANIDAWREKK